MRCFCCCWMQATATANASHIFQIPREQSFNSSQAENICNECVNRQEVILDFSQTLAPLLLPSNINQTHDGKSCSIIRFSSIDRECKQCANKSVPPRCCLAWASSVCFQEGGGMTDNCSQSRSRAPMSPRDQSLYYSSLKAFVGASHRNTIGTLASKQGFSLGWSLGPTRKTVWYYSYFPESLSFDEDLS